MPTRTRESTRTALIDAAKRLLPDRSPSDITGRGLASEAGVNYGLVHHYFGGKDAALTAGLVALRDDFITSHGDLGELRLLTEHSHPYLRALMRSHLDNVDPATLGGDFRVATSLVESVTKRLAGHVENPTDHDVGNEAQARVIAMVSIQLCYGVFGPALLEVTGVMPDQRADVEARLSELYDGLALL